MKRTLDMLKNVNEVFQDSAKRCRRETRPPLNRIPPYLDFNFKTRPYTYSDSSGDTKSGDMSDTVSVILLPRAFDAPGTVPGKTQLQPITEFLQNKYPQYSFIKGHMWNQEIGGPGETQNLVPLTSKANSSHKSNAETPLKDALRYFDTYYEINPAIKKAYGFKYVVEIEDAFWDGVEERIVPNSIHVQVFPIEYEPESRNYSDNNSIVNLIPDPYLKNKIDGLKNGIWIDQQGVVFML
ncbi:MAG: hypothetical protein AN485_16695 [Anabaena sp. MDT14b]|jgi:hypothetical protein|nr:MAG: hypothetical protein AN485_16695 [Anabaena sp. MDT14b]